MFLDVRGVRQLERTREEAETRDDEGALMGLLLDGIRQRPAPPRLAPSCQGIGKSSSLMFCFVKFKLDF